MPEELHPRLERLPRSRTKGRRPPGATLSNTHTWPPTARTTSAASALGVTTAPSRTASSSLAFIPSAIAPRCVIAELTATAQSVSSRTQRQSFAALTARTALPRLMPQPSVRFALFSARVRPLPALRSIAATSNPPHGPSNTFMLATCSATP